MDKVMNGLQKLGKSLMGAVAVLPVAAILMGIGYFIDPEGWGSQSIVAAILIKSGGAILDNLGWVFAVAIAFGLAKDKNGAASISAFVGYATVKALLGEKTVAGYRGIDLDALAGDDKLAWVAEGWSKINDGNVLIGILIGVLAAWCYNRFHTVKLPDFLAFFSGRRAVPIITSFFSIILSGILYFVWPLIYSGLFHLGQWIQGMGALGAGIYGFFNRLLIPFGLHHALNSIFWFDTIGISDISDFLGGSQTIAAAQAATSAAECPGNWVDGACQVVGVVGMYQGGFFPVMMFGLPAAALAMYLRADKQRRKVVGSLLAAGALASIFTGVTEPLEFSFMFAAPLLYVVHAILTGLAVGLAALMHWTAGFGFSAGLVDMVLSSQNPLANQWYMLLVQGLVWAVLYFSIFYFLIPLLNLKTPGRGSDPTDLTSEQVSGDSDKTEQARTIIAGLGGATNIDEVDYCATRLRIRVKDPAAASDDAIKKAGVAGVIRPSDRSVQVVIGPQVEFVYDEVARLLSNESVALNGEQDI